MKKITIRLLCFAVILGCAFAACTTANAGPVNSNPSKKHFKQGKSAHRPSKAKRGIQPKQHSMATKTRNQG